ncbi:hypothetical protein [Oceanobacillus kimchii]|nr:hypothetical protein [Oceanobacillus kimchii]
MRKWMINFFIDEPEETTVHDEIVFYSIMAMPIVIAIITFILV